MKRNIGILSFLLCMYLLSACKEDDYVYPNVVKEFIGASTDEQGTLNQLISDAGDTYRIQPRNGLGGLKKDTLYRTISLYQPIQEHVVQLYSCEPVLSMKPVTPDRISGGLKTDPVDIERMWLSGRYLNMVLLAQVKNQNHSYHFAEESFQTGTDGKSILHLRLHHNSNHDYEAFTRKVYLSVPLWTYGSRLKEGDQIVFHVHTYKEGDTAREFIYSY